MKLRPAKLSDFEELVRMFKDLIITVYEGFETNEDIFFYGTVEKWYHAKKDIIICEKDDGTITGFSVAYIEDAGFIKPYYMGDLGYTKPEYRKGRTAYLLYKNVVDYADQQGLSLVAKAFVGGDETDKIAQIQSKFGKPIFTEFHRSKEFRDGSN